jgi:hypothetical protein
MLWWVSRRMSWTTRLWVTVITLAVIICVLWFERSGFYYPLCYDIGGATNCANPGRLANSANQRSRCGSCGLLMPSTPNQRRA